MENKWYRYWMKHGFFHSVPDGRTPYTIVIPPPNVTGILHMGHMLNNTIQDVLIRRARLMGYNACWIPGTDHASIATEAKVVAKLKEQGISKSDISRDEFLKHAWAWTEKHGGVILDQLKKLGASCDWDRTKFTLDDDLYQSVIKVFVDLYNKGYVYRGYRMVNWDPEAKTNISDEEVVYKEMQGKLYYLKYPVEGTDDYIQVATTRPETIFGDTAVCINPHDERYAYLKGKRVIVPIANHAVPVIEDEYVDMEFGTGCLKVTPAHDINDYEIGKRHGLEVIDAIDDDATLNDHALHYSGKDRFVARKEIEAELKAKGLLEKVESYTNNVGTSERTGAVIEPKLSVQWFLKMKALAKPALDNVMNDTVRFHPAKFKNTYRHWMENVHDWNISRQLWWGHQIPAWYYGKDQDDFVVAESAEGALELAKAKSGDKNLTSSDLKQDEDVLDTWFSSWLWPMSVFDGIRNPDNGEIEYYYPTQDLVTAPEIMFFWVARMIMAGYEYRGTFPFRNVYFTGIVRDKQSRKMSKSLGNSPDALKLIDQYGADGVRAGLLLSAPAGNDLLFDEALCRQGSSFANKIWNAYRLVSGWKTEDKDQPDYAATAVAWYGARFQQALEEMDAHFEKYRISDALMVVYKLMWGDFCSWFLEMIKPARGGAMDETTYRAVVVAFEDNLKLLHPFMPFISEEIWQQLKPRTPEEALIIARWPEKKTYDKAILGRFEFASEVISNIRSIRKEKKLAFSKPIDLAAIDNEKAGEGFDPVIKKLGNIAELTYTTEKADGALRFRVKSNEYFIPVEGAVDVGAEKKRLEKELQYARGFLGSVQKKLQNERFVNNAPEQVVAAERKKEADALAKIKVIEEGLSSLPTP